MNSLSQHEMEALTRMCKGVCKHITLALQSGVLVGDLRGIAFYDASGHGRWMIGDAKINHCPLCGKVLPTHGEPKKESAGTISFVIGSGMFGTSSEYTPNKYDPEDDD